MNEHIKQYLKASHQNPEIRHSNKVWRLKLFSLVACFVHRLHRFLVGRSWEYARWALTSDLLAVCKHTDKVWDKQSYSSALSAVSPCDPVFTPSWVVWRASLGWSPLKASVVEDHTHPVIPQEAILALQCLGKNAGLGQMEAWVGGGHQRTTTTPTVPRCRNACWTSSAWGGCMRVCVCVCVCVGCVGESHQSLSLDKGGGGGGGGKEGGGHQKHRLISRRGTTRSTPGEVGSYSWRWQMWWIAALPQVLSETEQPLASPSSLIYRGRVKWASATQIRHVWRILSLRVLRGAY